MNGTNPQFREMIKRAIGRGLEQGAVAHVPRDALLRILAMAEEMSFCITYGAHDENGEYLGVASDVTKDLQIVRQWLGLRAARRPT